MRLTWRKVGQSKSERGRISLFATGRKIQSSARGSGQGCAEPTANHPNEPALRSDLISGCLKTTQDKRVASCYSHKLNDLCKRKTPTWNSPESSPLRELLSPSASTPSAEVVSVAHAESALFSSPMASPPLRFPLPQWSPESPPREGLTRGSIRRLVELVKFVLLFEEEKEPVPAPEAMKLSRLPCRAADAEAWPPRRSCCGGGRHDLASRMLFKRPVWMAESAGWSCQG